MKMILSGHFTTGRLLRFVFPSVVMMIFTSIYGVVDGVFVSIFAGKSALAAVNVVWPVISILSSAGFMFGTGGSALVGRTLGEEDRETADGCFSLLVYTLIAIGAVMTVLGLLLLRPLCIFFGASGPMLEDCIIYGRILLAFTVVNMLQLAFQCFLITAGKPTLNLVITLASGFANIVLDYLLVGVLDWGIAGAAWATAASMVIGGALPVLYFLLPNRSLLRLTRPLFSMEALWQACSNGFSELLTTVSSSVVTILYNFQLMAIAGEDGIASYSIIMYVTFIFTAMYTGYSIGCAPVVSYHYGAGNRKEVRSLLRKSLVLVGLAGVGLTLLAEVLAQPLSWLFVGYDPALMSMTCHGFRIYSFSFLLSGISIYGSSFFTALNNGVVSATISFLRTMVFQMGMVLILPRLLGLEGIWLAVVAAELLSSLVTFLLLWRKSHLYL